MCYLFITCFTALSVVTFMIALRHLYVVSFHSYLLFDCIVMLTSSPVNYDRGYCVSPDKAINDSFSHSDRCGGGYHCTFKQWHRVWAGAKSKSGLVRWLAGGDKLSHPGEA
jgi:hypothetical protein